MDLLLDTHAFIWWVNGNERLPQRARRAIDDDANTVFVSAVSAWEIATKYRRGRLYEAVAIAPDIAAAIATQDFEELPITVEDAARAGALPGPLRDPFDRMLNRPGPGARPRSCIQRDALRPVRRPAPVVKA